MAIKTIKLPLLKPEHPVFFRDSVLAHKYLDGLKGIEIGAAAHNPFNLEGSISVGLVDKDYVDYDFFRGAQVAMCGEYAVIDIDAEADHLPLLNNSQSYVITSHVGEHLPDLIGAFLEWDRVVRPGGYIFTILPKRDALPDDRLRPVTLTSEFVRAHKEKWTATTVPLEVMATVPGGARGHYWVFTLDSILRLIDYMRLAYGCLWEVVEALETDDKVGNGHCVVIRKIEPHHLPVTRNIAALSVPNLSEFAHAFA